MTPTILFPASTAAAYLPDSAFEEEAKAAAEAGFHVAFIGLEAFFGEEPSFRKLPDSSGLVIYRGWILTKQNYERMADALAHQGFTLLSSLDNYLYGYHLPNWYADLDGMTPKSIWFRTGEDQDFDLLMKGDSVLPSIVWNEFRGGATIVKDFVKSRKHEWYDACFIPRYTPPECEPGDCPDSYWNRSWDNNVMRVVRNFVERQGESLVGGIVFREFIELKQIGIHSKSRLPLVNEHRFFVLNNEVVYQAPYWGEGDYSGNHPTPSDVAEAISRLRAPFLTIDVAERENGGWEVVEVGNGETSGVPEGGDIFGFYRALMAVYSKT
jgi:hypothetical protein